MKNILVLSQVTYVPKNCNNLIEILLKTNSQDIHTIIVLNNMSFSLYYKIIWLSFVGCHRIANQLIKNLFSIACNQKEKIARKYSIPIIKTQTMNNPKIIKYIKDNQIQAIFNVRTRCIYKNEVLNAPTIGCFNIHHGILPTYRGMYCDLYALAENRPAGISLHRMNQKIDDGPIIYSQNISTGDKDYIQYLSKTSLAESKLITQFINLFQTTNQIPPTKPNNPSKKIYTKTPSIKQIRKFISQGLKL